MRQSDTRSRSSLIRYAWLSIAAALATIVLKGLAYWLTGSVGLLSDAVESLVNLVGALVALAMLTVASRPADDDHHFGHGKAEYFSSGVEGTLILIAAISIAVAAMNRLISPKPLEQMGVGLAVSCVASLINFGVARVLLSAGKKHESITLEADARHLMTDVWTSVGVIGGLAAVTLTGWQRLDPVVAIAVALNIVWTGYQLVQRSVLGLLDTALPTNERQTIAEDSRKIRKRGYPIPCSQDASGRRPPIRVGACTGSWRVDCAAAAINCWSDSKWIFAMHFAT